ncbi:MAG: hypothetical protein HY315_03530 [Acidobacteria bacterium]|nr:hypothetical protein [Acidobacteriota bacterium]
MTRVKLGELKDKVALDLFQIGAVKFGPPLFRLKLHESQPDAPLSPIYVNLRIIRSYPQVLKETVDLYLALASGLDFDVIADVPTASTPIATLMCSHLNLPMVSPRLDARTHGMTTRIDGAWHPGQKCLLVDDLITRSHSKLEAIRSLEENGLKVSSVIVLIDRQQGGVEELNKQGYPCVFAYRLVDLLDGYRSSRLITEEQYRETLAYLESAGG